jgi:superfamily II DNA or RNA helicase
MSITLRPYQQKMIDQIYSFIKKGLTRLLVYAAMRSGKTIVFCFIAAGAKKKGKRVLIVTDRKVLYDQTSKSLKAFDLHPFYIKAGIKNPPKNSEPTLIATSITLENRLKDDNWRKHLKVDIIIIDEAHRQSFNYIFKEPMFSESLILGFTGSPIRTGSQTQLGDQYQQLVLGPNTKELETLGFSVPLRVFDYPSPDMGGVSKDSAGEFNNYETFKKFDSPTLYAGVVDNWLKICPGVCTIVYCVNIQHAVKTCESFNNAGIVAKFITSAPAKPNTLKADAKPADITKHRIKSEAYEYYQYGFNKWAGDINDWKNGDYPVLINVDIFTFGFDHPPMLCGILNRATASTALLLQMGLRPATPFKGKNEAYLLDFGGNIDRLADGEYNKVFDWSLFHYKKDKGDGVPSSKECPKCQALCFASAKVCEWCGFEFPKTSKELFVELVEKKYSNKKPSELSINDMTIEEIEEYAKQKKYKKPWVWRQIYVNAGNPSQSKEENKIAGEKALKLYAKKSGYHWSWAKHVVDRY